MKKNKKTHRIGSCLIALFFILMLSCSKPAEIVEVVEPIVPAPVIAYVKVPAPKIICEKLTEIVGLVDVSGQYATMLPVVLAGFGYPNPEEFSPDADVTTFFIEGEGVKDVKHVIFAKVTGEGVLSKQILNKGYQQEQKGEWTIFYKEEGLLAKITNFEELAKIASESSLRDVDMNFYAQSMLKHKEELLGLIEEEQKKKPSEHDVIGIANAVFDELDDVKNFKLGLDLSKEKIVLITDILARKGTPLGKFLSPVLKGKNSSARFIESGRPMEMVGEFDPESAIVYMDHIFEIVKPFLNEEMKKEASELQKSSHEYIEYAEGSFAMAGEFKEGVMHFDEVVDGDFTNEQVLELFNKYEGMQDAIMSILNGVNPDMEMSYEFKANEMEVDGIPVHFMTVAVDLKNVPGHEQKPSKTYVAVCKGKYLVSTTKAGITELIKRVKGGSPAANELAKTFDAQLLPAMMVRIDMVRYYKGILMSEPMIAAMAGPIFEKLEKEEFPPLIYSVDMKDASLSAKMIMPIEKLFKFAAPILMEMQAKQMQK